jgi:hypothetical protein
MKLKKKQLLDFIVAQYLIGYTDKDKGAEMRKYGEIEEHFDKWLTRMQKEKV